jgi:hypothetical protein
MAFKLLFGPRCDDQVSDLRRQEATQPAHALDFASATLSSCWFSFSTSSFLSRSSFNNRAF